LLSFAVAGVPAFVELIVSCASATAQTTATAMKPAKFLTFICAPRAQPRFIFVVIIIHEHGVCLEFLFIQTAKTTS
ncbi:MAG TPA: hypothetical protein PK373_05955, partial [Sedimentisphaerales bacterium]|nr:hypothetical protein [Sedimentisphaerales bacterium]